MSLQLSVSMSGFMQHFLSIYLVFTLAYQFLPISPSYSIVTQFNYYLLSMHHALAFTCFYIIVDFEMLPWNTLELKSGVFVVIVCGP